METTKTTPVKTKAQAKAAVLEAFRNSKITIAEVQALNFEIEGVQKCAKELPGIMALLEITPKAKRKEAIIYRNL
jgi:hypothetical protein